MKRAYYNENDEFAASWLRNLISAGLVAPGDVDDRSIKEVKPDDLRGYAQCHFFAGIGGWSHALRLAGWPDDKPVWTGSCPCQPFSAAGRRKGFADDRHLWPEFRRLIGECRPAVVFGEQVASAASWLGLVRGDLEALEYAVGAMPVEAASAGADHLRDRFWFVGHDTRIGRGEGRPEYEVRGGRNALAGNGGDDLADRHHQGPQGWALAAERAGERVAGPDGVADDLGVSDCARSLTGSEAKSSARYGHPSAATDREYDWAIGADGKARRVKPGVRLLVNGFPNRVGLLRGFGNAIDPRPAAEFIRASGL